MKVIPHGIDLKQFSSNGNIYQIKTNKKYKLLCNIQQPHIRKGLPTLLEVYGKAFTNKDDVCLVIKGVDKPVINPFEVSLKMILNDFYNKYKNHAEIKVITEYIDDLSTIYRACDILFMLPHSEGFGLPFLEGLATEKVVFAPNWGGQIDFLNENNSILVNGKEIEAPPQALYWEQKRGTIYFQPDISEAVDKIRFTVNNYDSLKQKFNKNAKLIINNYSWDKISHRILNACN